jgi:hypothetical protein
MWKIHITQEINKVRYTPDYLRPYKDILKNKTTIQREYTFNFAEFNNCLLESAGFNENNRTFFVFFT